MEQSPPELYSSIPTSRRMQRKISTNRGMEQSMLEPDWGTTIRQIRPPSLSPPSSGGEDYGGRTRFDHSALLQTELGLGRSRLNSISEEVATSTPRLPLTPSISPPEVRAARSLSPGRDERSLSPGRDERSISPGRDKGTLSPGSSLELKESEDSNPRFKTEICRNYKEKGSCLYGPECQFAHGNDEMRDSGKQNKYKTKLCQKYWIAGYCAYGPRCNFLHKKDGEAGQPEPSARRKKNSVGDTSRESYELNSPSLSPTTVGGAQIPPLSALLWPKFGSGRLAAFPHQDSLTWVDTWTNRIV
jgi:hypothetical protein